jgi:uncharacterized membrane protein HdeD (DUF308 family)
MLSRNWWLIVLRGVCAIVFGILAFISPRATLQALILLWGAYAFISGLLAFAGALFGSSGTPWWVLVLEGVVSIAAAAVAIFLPGLTAIGLLYLMAGWAIITGALEIEAAIELRREIKGEVWLALAGIASILFGLLLIMRPGVGVLAVIWMIGAYAIAFGGILVVLGFRVKGMHLRTA